MTSSEEKQTSDRDLVIVANRLPMAAERSGDGLVWETSPGGLVAALAPAIEGATNATWVGWSGIVGETPVPDLFDHLRVVPVPLSELDVERYYEGFSNGCIWPLYHDSIEYPAFRRPWWDSYVSVNQRFAEEVARTARPNSRIWIHDYQLQLVPKMLRDLRPDLWIGFFLHIPFPSPEIFMRLPWRRQIVEGILGADMVGFQTPLATQDFRVVARRLTGAARAGANLELAGREILVDSFPIGIHVERFESIANEPETADRMAALRTLLGNPEQIILGVDRLDYTKGIELRLRALRELLDEGRIDPRKTAMIQVAEPSRGGTRGYARIRTEVERLAGGINGDFGSMGVPVIHYQHQSVPIDDLVALFRIADVMLVTPFADGMNLVAKEYVAARTDFEGVLVLSEFAGAAVELKEAIMVNPYDIEGVKDAIITALSMEPQEQRRRMKALARRIQANPVSRWAASFLEQRNQ